MKVEVIASSDIDGEHSHIFASSTARIFQPITWEGRSSGSVLVSIGLSGNVSQFVS